MLISVFTDNPVLGRRWNPQNDKDYLNQPNNLLKHYPKGDELDPEQFELLLEKYENGELNQEETLWDKF